MYSDGDFGLWVNTKDYMCSAKWGILQCLTFFPPEQSVLFLILPEPTTPGQKSPLTSPKISQLCCSACDLEFELRVISELTVLFFPSKPLTLSLMFNDDRSLVLKCSVWAWDYIISLFRIRAVFYRRLLYLWVNICKTARVQGCQIRPRRISSSSLWDSRCTPHTAPETMLWQDGLPAVSPGLSSPSHLLPPVPEPPFSQVASAGDSVSAKTAGCRKTTDTVCFWNNN